MTLRYSGLWRGTDTFGLDIAKGSEPGISSIHKFGRAIVGTTFTPIAFGGIYQTPTTATALEVVSDDANDTSAGSGGRQVTITGLDSSWEEVSQTVTLNGTTPVNLPTDLTRAYRMMVVSSGTYATASSASHVGAITLQVQGAGAAWASINDSGFPRGQTEIGAYTVPIDKVAYVKSIVISADTNKSSDILFFRRDNADDVSSPYSGVMRAILELGGISGEETVAPFVPFGPFIGPCDIGFLGKVSSTTGEVDVDFEIMLLDK